MYQVIPSPTGPHWERAKDERSFSSFAGERNLMKYSFEKALDCGGKS